MAAVAPRSIRSHCGSLQALDQRVVRSPSTAAPAGVDAPSSEEATAGLAWEIRSSAASAAWNGLRADTHSTAAAAVRMAVLWKVGPKKDLIGSPGWGWIPGGA